MAFEDFNYEPRIVQDHLYVRLLAMDRVRLDHRWHAQSVQSSFWRLYINEIAAATIAVGGRKHALIPHRIHLLPAWVAFDCWSARPCWQFFIHFDLVGWPPAVVRELFKTPLALPASASIAALAKSVTAEIQAGKGDSPMATANAKAIVYLAVARIAPSIADAPAGRLLQIGPSPIRDAVQYIERHLPETINNQILAGACHLSRSHFIREFRKAFGQTPAQYVRERRVSRAAEQLALSRRKIEEIAIACGFPNRFYFSRAFRAVMGVSPARYRDRAV